MQYSEQTPEVTYSCGFWSGLKPIYYLNFAAQLKRVNCDSNSNLKFPVSKSTKHGTLTLALPSKLFWTDITIHMDIQRNPGPPLAEFRSVVQTPATNLNSNLPVVDRIKYSRGQLFKLRFKSPVSSELYLSLRANGILYNRRTRAGRSVKSRSSSIPVLTAFRRSDCSIRYKHCHRFADHKNLVSIQRCSSTRTIAAGTCLKFCTWNARSIRNKSASFLDYICENNIDLITVTETWLSENDAAVRAACTPIGYKLTDCPRVGRCGGGTALIYRSSLSVTEVISGTKPSF